MSLNFEDPYKASWLRLKYDIKFESGKNTSDNIYNIYYKYKF